MKKVILGALMAAALCVSAEMKIGTVNMVDLVRLHPNHASNKALVKSTDSDYKDKLEKMQEQVKAIADEGKKIQEDFTNLMLSASAKADAQKKLEGVQQRFVAAHQLHAAKRRVQQPLPK